MKVRETVPFTLSHNVGGTRNCYSSMEGNPAVSTKLQMHTPFHPAIPPVGMGPTDIYLCKVTLYEASYIVQTIYCEMACKHKILETT